jgi:hypothetical protein
MATVIKIVNYDRIGITIINYDPKTFIVQATGHWEGSAGVKNGYRVSGLVFTRLPVNFLPQLLNYSGPFCKTFYRRN